MVNTLGNACCGCSLCREVCPQKCIEFVLREDGFWYPSINKEECINCGLCNSMCPVYNPIVSKCKNEGYTIPQF